MNETRNPIYRFDAFEIDVTRGNLESGGQVLHLRPKTFQVLVYLIAHRGKDVTKDELINEFWKDTAVVDDVLVQSIKDIRRALGDDTRRPRFIRTIPKIGYRFIGTIEEAQAKAVGSQQSAVDNARRTTNNEKKIESEIRHSNSKFGIRRPIFLTVSVFLIILSIFLFSSQTLRQQSEEITLANTAGKKPVVVMFFENQSDDAELNWLREGLTDMLITDLSRSEQLTVLGRGQLSLLLERTRRDAAKKIPLDAALEIARRTGAETLVTGCFARLGEKMRIEVQIYDAATGQLNAAESLTVDRPEQILTEIDLLSLKLAKRLSSGESEAGKYAGLAEAMTNNLEAYRYYSLGVEQAQALHNIEAIKLLEKAIELDSRFAMAHARIGYAYAVTWNLEEKGKPFLEKAFQLSERLTEKDRLNIAAWYAIANLDYQSAAEKFRYIINVYPLEIEAYYRLARILQGEGQVAAAINVYRQGLAIDPEAKNLYNGLGSALSILGRHDEAIAAHQRYVALAPNESNAYDSLGLSYQWSGDYEAAIVSYNHALELNPSFEVAIIHLANVYFQIGRYQKAIDLYHRYIENAPSDDERARGYFSVAMIYFKNRNFALAEKNANEVIKLKKEWAWSSYVIALEQGDAAKAEKLKESFFSGKASSNRGSKPSRRSEFYYRGYVALKKNLSEEAITNFQEATRYSPQIWDMDAYEDCLANAYLESGRTAEAIAEYERILKLNPNYPLARFHLAQAFERQNQITEARENYRQFLENWKSADADIPEIIAARNSLGE